VCTAKGAGEAQLVGVLGRHGLQASLQRLKHTDRGHVHLQNVVHLVALVLGTVNRLLIHILLARKEGRVLGPNREADPHIVQDLVAQLRPARALGMLVLEGREHKECVRGVLGRFITSPRDMQTSGHARPRICTPACTLTGTPACGAYVLREGAVRGAVALALVVVDFGEAVRDRLALHQVRL
jgi:hypothetical protein